MANIGVNPEAIFPYQLLFHGPSANADYLNFVQHFAVPKLLEEGTHSP
jgi:hypothetical protein